MTGFFDDALAAADRVDPGGVTPEGLTHTWKDIHLLVRALREAVALNRGISAESEGLRQRLRAEHGGGTDLAEASDAVLLAEVARRLRVTLSP